jgi:hypothetical protein
VFKNTLLDKIVCYTNDYGKVKAKRWQDINRKDQGSEGIHFCPLCFCHPKKEGQAIELVF